MRITSCDFVAKEWRFQSAPLHGCSTVFLAGKTPCLNFAHLPLLAAPPWIGNGKAFQSGTEDKLGVPVFPIGYGKNQENGETCRWFSRETTRLPYQMRFLNFIGCSWAGIPGDDREIFSSGRIDRSIFRSNELGSQKPSLTIAKGQMVQCSSTEPFVPFADLAAHFLYCWCRTAARDSKYQRKKAKTNSPQLLKEPRYVSSENLWAQGFNLSYFHCDAFFDDDIASKKWNPDAVKVLLRLMPQSLEKTSTGSFWFQQSCEKSVRKAGRLIPRRIKLGKVIAGGFAWATTGSGSRSWSDGGIAI